MIYHVNNRSLVLAIWPSDVQPVLDDGSGLWTSVQGHILDDVS